MVYAIIYRRESNFMQLTTNNYNAKVSSIFYNDIKGYVCAGTL